MKSSNTRIAAGILFPLIILATLCSPQAGNTHRQAAKAIYYQNGKHSPQAVAETRP
jgi:hypothetical protein